MAAPKVDPDAPKGVLGQHRDRMENDKSYRESALTPPGGGKPVGPGPNSYLKS